MNKYKTLAHEIMESEPEASFCLQCIGWDYQAGTYLFQDVDGTEYTVTETQIADALPIVRKKLREKKLFLDGLHSGDESFLDAGNWDAIATDAAVQIAIFKDVIYG